jgi:proteasome lid subunit RPN8/RPN11
VKAVHLPEKLLSEIRAHAREAYPEECCGFLIGPANEPEQIAERTILALERAGNEFEGERRRRFLIPPEELRILERRLEKTGQVVVGFYHSHPDHPARPSRFDQDHAWPWYSYLVMAVTASDTPAIGAFELEPDSATFHEVPLSVAGQGPTGASVTPGLGRA